jgi:hypothetical protein
VSPVKYELGFISQKTTFFKNMRLVNVTDVLLVAVRGTQVISIAPGLCV